MFDLPVFALLVAAAFYLRKQPQAHKRFIILATVAIIGAAVNRLPLPPSMSTGLVRFALLDLFAVALIAWDFVSRRGVHAATVVGTLALLTDEVAQTLLRDSPAWAKVVARMVA